MAKSIRNAAYFIARLKKDHPAIHADLIARKYLTTRSAAIAAGIVKPNTRLNVLKNAWLKANSDEREEFLDWLVAQGHLAGHGVMSSGPAHSKKPAIPGGIKSTGLTTSASQSALDANRRLQPWARAKIEEIMAARSLTASKAMNEIQPLSSIHDGSLGNAIHQDGRLPRIDAALLEAWIEENSVNLGL